MKKQVSILGLGLALAGYNLGFSQETKIQPCNTYEAMETHFKEDPAARVRYEANQKQLHDEFVEYSKNKAANRTAAPVYTVPVVFHILHQGGPENIPDATCIAALQQINEDYARQGADTNTIFTPFKSLYINSDIKFMLAKRDPQGNCINGIVRHVDPKTNWSQTQANAGTAAGNAYWSYTWDPTSYLNIYVVANIVPQGTVTGNGVIVGYTYRPGTWPTSNPHDAIVYRYNYLGVGPSTGYQVRSLSHEMGHWLSLAHTFGNTNNPGVACGSSYGGDGMNDTPDTKGNFGTCGASSTNTNYVCGSPDPTNPNLYYQNIENIMDYSSCPKNFTTDQTNAMRSTLASNVNGRNNISSPTNLGPAGTDINGLGLCRPTADYLSTSNSYTVCSGGTLTMKDASSNNPQSWAWTAGGGAVIASPSSSLTNITFNTIGVVDVTLTVTNAQGSNMVVRSVTVLDGTPGLVGSNMESFENPGVPSGWMLMNDPANSTFWQQTQNAAYDQITSYYVDGPTTGAGQRGYLEMPTIDLLNNPGSILTFAYAYARQSPSQNDVFRLQLSKDCGASWTDVITLNANLMAFGSGGVNSAPFIPASSEWKVEDATTYPAWNNFINSPSVKVRFNFEEGPSGFGNNFYLDAINISVPVATGINALTKSIKLNLYPNPSTGESNLNFTLSDAASVQVSVVDVLGKEALPASSYSFNAGEHTVVINKDNVLPKGAYIVNMSLNGAKMSRKLIIN